ncbi:MAG: hypothetical protein IJT75_06925 [Bacteroidaceae bacterium]|nr:hypothetical protein [Bacteroidaceae bacterium]
MKKILIGVCTLLLAVCTVTTLRAESVTVHLHTDASFSNPGGIMQRLETNLGALLTEINNASTAGRDLSLTGLNMNDYARNSLRELWQHVHFFCDDAEVFDRCWPMQQGYMVRQIPLIMDTQDADYNASRGVGAGGLYQEAVVEFDQQGRISDFRFTFDTHRAESMERCGASVTDMERRMQILSYCDRFRTAYCTKDLAYLQQVFSDDALIITGKVVTARASEMRPGSATIKYTQQTKKQYLANLANAFKRNKFIDVKFTEVGASGEGCGSISQSVANPNYYGVRLRQEWRSSTYSDDGYVFLLWDFTDEAHPVIHVRTWQPEYLDAGKTQHIKEDDIFDLSKFDL